ncbi:hypothetical protein LNP44_14165 [Klebsiella pneumoniae subsp. pneumoniae]|nr:hypothetical protein [Klebsiella pneumoniae subsp. pneumoniae]
MLSPRYTTRIQDVLVVK